MSASRQNGVDFLSLVDHPSGVVPGIFGGVVSYRMLQRAVDVPSGGPLTEPGVVWMALWWLVLWYISFVHIDCE